MKTLYIKAYPVDGLVPGPSMYQMAKQNERKQRQKRSNKWVAILVLVGVACYLLWSGIEIALILIGLGLLIGNGSKHRWHLYKSVFGLGIIIALLYMAIMGLL